MAKDGTSTDDGGRDDPPAQVEQPSDGSDERADGPLWSSAWWWRTLRLGVVVGLLALLGWGGAHASPRGDEPQPIPLELAGTTARFGAALSDQAPSVWRGPTCTAPDSAQAEVESLDRSAPEEVVTTDHPQCAATPVDCSAGVAINGEITTLSDVPACLSGADLAGDGVERDWVFIPAYALPSALLCLLAALTARGAKRRCYAAGIVAALLAGALDVFENGQLLEAVELHQTELHIRLAAWSATMKFALVPVFGLIAAAAAFHFVWGPRGGVQPTRRFLDRRHHWAAPPAKGSKEDPTWEQGAFGIALSGGGIRSASFCLGALQRLSEVSNPGVISSFHRARYLSAVSGGGYIAGAMQLHGALQQAPGVYEAGSAEADHLRRHGNYLADTGGEWVRALSNAFLRLLGNLVLLTLAVVALAQPLGWIGRLLVAGDLGATGPDAWPRIPEGVLVALFALGVPALVLGLASRNHVARPEVPPEPGSAQAARNQAQQVGERATSMAEEASSSEVTTLPPVEDELRLSSAAAVVLALALGGAAVVVLLTAVLIPLLDALAQHVTDWVDPPEGAATAAWPAALATALLAWVQKNALQRETTGGTESPGDRKAKKPRIPWAGSVAEAVAGPVVALVVLAYLVALASIARDAGPDGAVLTIAFVGIRSWWVFVGAGLVVVVLVSSIDAVSWSLHGFYKRRLWSAFTYDPIRGTERPWSLRPTLSGHGAPVGRPELVLCGAAQVSGPSLAPPGRRAVTWTFDSRWVGGPEIGWCRTEDMEGALAKGKAGDASLFGAVAISGAAFGSAMGRHSKGTLNALLALSNTRLGVWLPNPRLLGQPNAWKPRRRRNLRYLIREISGRYDPDDDWILVSDGGHYENLGLVELLRRGCEHIVCFDASGDGSGRNATFAEALRLAEEELGVTVVVDEPWRSAPGSADEDELSALPERLADALEGRLASSPLVEATITYPRREEWRPPSLWPPRDLPRHGRLILGRSILAPDAPWPVLSYAGGNDDFPNDPTHDQWFDHEQYMNYRLLGRAVGDAVKRRIDGSSLWAAAHEAPAPRPEPAPADPT